MKYLPKPGVWMERFKQITGFIMLAVVVWLFSVMAGSRPNAAIHLSWYLLALAVACWAMGAYQYRVTRWVVFPLVAIAGYFGILQGPLAERSRKDVHVDPHRRLRATAQDRGQRDDPPARAVSAPPPLSSAVTRRASQTGLPT